MKKILFFFFLIICSCERNPLPDGNRDNCVDLDFNKACLEVSKRGIGIQSCEEDNKCHLICQPLDKEIQRECCHNNNTYKVFLKKLYSKA